MHTEAEAAAAVAREASKAKTSSRWSWRKGALIGTGLALGGAGFALAEEEAEHGLHAPEFPWSHEGYFSAYDHAAIR